MEIKNRLVEYSFDPQGLMMLPSLKTISTFSQIVFVALWMIGMGAASPASATRFCFVGDTGMATKGQYKVGRKMAANCDEVFILGDIIYPDGIQSASDPQLELKFWKPYVGIKKLIIALGNHDYKGKVKYWVPIAKAHSQVYHPHRFFEYRSGDTCFIILDTTPLLWKDYDKEQRKFLENLSFRDCKLKIAIGHHPYRSTMQMPSEGKIREDLDKYIMGKFDYYIAGHAHFMENAGVHKGTRLIVSGAGAESRRCSKDPLKRLKCYSSMGYYRISNGEGVFIPVTK